MDLTQAISIRWSNRLWLLLLQFYGPLSGTTRVSWYQKTPTHTYPDHQSSFICFLHLLWSIASSLFNLRTWQSFFAQPLSKSSLVYLLVWHPPLHTPYISSPSHCLLFTALAHTNTTCFAIILRLCTNFSFALTPIYTLVRPELITGFKQPLQINDFGHATLYTTICLQCFDTVGWVAGRPSGL